MPYTGRVLRKMTMHGVNAIGAKTFLNAGFLWMSVARQQCILEQLALNDNFRRFYPMQAAVIVCTCYTDATECLVE